MAGMYHNVTNHALRTFKLFTIKNNTDVNSTTMFQI